MERLIRSFGGPKPNHLLARSASESTCLIFGNRKNTHKKCVFITSLQLSGLLGCLVGMPVLLIITSK
jgi:hypothetical protein